MKKFIIKNDNKMVSFKSGFKKDNLHTKPRFDLIPYEPLERVAIQFTNGAKKYGIDNWKKASNKEEQHIFFEAALRHILKLNEEVNNPETKDGEDHLSATITNLMMYGYHTK